MRAAAAILGIGLATSVALAGGSHCSSGRHWDEKRITTYYEVGDPWYEDVDDTHGSVRIMWQWHRLPSGVTLLRYRNVSYDYVHAEWHFGPWTVEYKACEPHCRVHHVHHYYTECGHHTCRHCRHSCCDRGHHCEAKRSVHIHRSRGCEVRYHRPRRSVKVEVHAPLPPIPRIHIHKSRPSCRVEKKTVVRVEKHRAPVRRHEVRKEVKVKRHHHKKRVREIEIKGMGKRSVQRKHDEGRRRVSIQVNR